jgi:hypothetical protein
MSTVPSGTRFIGISTNVNLTERKSAVLNAETQPYTIEDLAATVGVGSEGPQGVQGPAGPPGPVGPAGLEWQGEWVSGTSYVADDAVGYDGASWFCILATSGTTAPDVDTTHWALLASQGAIGPQGVQGPTGPQGPAGSNAYSTWRAVINYNSVVNVLVNEIGFTSPVITNPSNGEILITKTGFFTSIDENKLDLITATVNNLGTPYVCTLEKYGFAPNNSLILNVFDMDGTQTSTPACNFTVEIRIYN